jgi:hypothetical protein
MGVGERDGITRFRLLRLASSCQVQIVVGNVGFRNGTGLTPQIQVKDAQLPR